MLHAAALRGEGPFPGLLLIPDVRGVSDHFLDAAGRFAAEGFFTAVIDLYSREGPPDLPDMPAVFD
ncbi:MAG: dienelactone hydrolase family protein [Candidatus Binatia bacterium]